TPFLNYAYGSALATTGDEKGSLARLRQELMVFPQNALAQVSMSQMELKMGKASAAQELAVAEKHLASMVSPDPQIARLYARAAADGPNIATSKENDAAFDEFAHEAATLQAEGKTNQAIESYEKALRIRPNWDDGLWNLAMLDYSQG